MEAAAAAAAGEAASRRDDGRSWTIPPADEYRRRQKVHKRRLVAPAWRCYYYYEKKSLPHSASSLQGTPADCVDCVRRTCVAAPNWTPHFSDSPAISRDMVFVYQQSNKGPRPGADPCEHACKPMACQLQKCIATLPVSQATGVMQLDLCRHWQDKWTACCDRILASGNNGG